MKTLAGWNLGLVVYFAATCAAADVVVDTDGDLLPDAWELQHGLNPGNPSDADQDVDNDRLTARDEYLAGTEPSAATLASAMSDRQLLDLFQGKAFVYFWEQSRPPYFLTPDSAHFDNRSSFSDNFNSIATTGFGLLAYVVADERGWVDHQAAYERIRALLARLVELQGPAYDIFNPQNPTAPLSGQANRHGYLYHFVDNQGYRLPGVEISTVDHAFLVAGALLAGQYYRGTEDRKSVV